MTGQRTRSLQCVVLVVLLLGRTSALVIPGLEMDCYIQAGDLNIAYMKEIHSMSIESLCGQDLESEYEMQYVEAFRWAVDQVNLRTDLLRNISLGFAVLDDCGRDLTALAKSMYIIPNNDR